MFHENRLLKYHVLSLRKSGKISQNLSSAAVVISALWVKHILSGLIDIARFGRDPACANTGRGSPGLPARTFLAWHRAGGTAPARMALRSRHPYIDLTL